VESEITELHGSLNSDEKRIILVGNKKDLLSEKSSELGNVIYISAKEGDNIESLLNEIDRFVTENGIRDTSMLANERHQALLSGIAAAADRAQQGLRNNLPADLVAEDIRVALHDLGELTGTITTEDLLNNIFGKFCIGK
jgi:tRNA modification GTPase